MLALIKMNSTVHEDEGTTSSPALMAPNNNSLESITVIRHVLITGEDFCREKVTFSVTWPPGCVCVSPSHLILSSHSSPLYQEQQKLYLQHLLKNSRPAELRTDYRHASKTALVRQGMEGLEVRLVMKSVCTSHVYI